MANQKEQDIDTSEHRMDLRLSNPAYEVLLADRDAFGAKGVSTIIHRIIELCAINRKDSGSSIVESEVNIDEAVSRRRDKLISDIKVAKAQEEKEVSPSQESKSGKKEARGTSGEKPTETEITPEEEQTVEYIVSSYRNELIDRFVNRPISRDQTIKLRFQNAIYYNYVNFDGISDSKAFPYYNDRRKYIIALLEDYARKPYFMREEIYFHTMYKKICDKINVPLKKRELLRITLSNGSVFRIKPYRMSTEGEAPYHYLIGLSKVSEKNKNGTKEYEPIVIRLSRIETIYELGEAGSGKITSDEKTNLDTRFKDKGVAFLGDPEENVEYTVSLTPKGMRKYNQIIHLRPVAIGKKEPDKNRPGNTLLRFKCAENKIIYYFTRLCGDAIIVSPKETADKMARQYKEAYTAYKNK